MGKPRTAWWATWWAASLLAAAASSARAQATTGAAFLKISSSVRSYALGMANGITALGSEAIGTNPANLGLMPSRYDVFTSYASLMDGTHYENLAAAFAPRANPLGLDGLGLSVTRLESGNFAGADAAGNQTGSSFNSADTAIALAGSAKVTPSLRAGVTGKYIKSQIAGYSSSPAYAADLGLTYTGTEWLNRPISLGASVTNIGSGIRFIQQTDKLPTAANVGLALPIGGFVAVLEVNRFLYQQQTQFGTGLEYSFGPVSFRAGYLEQGRSSAAALSDQKNGALLAGLSGGVGVRVGAARLDYAMSRQGAEFGTTQRVGLSLQWGGRNGARPSARGLNDYEFHDKSDWLIRDLGWR